MGFAGWRATIRLRWVMPALFASALFAGTLAGNLPTAPAFAAPACEDGQVATADGCVTEAVVAERIDAIVQAAMAKHHLKAVLAGVAIDGRPLAMLAKGESMTGVQATPAMHFRAGAVAIAYMGTVLLQQHDKGVLALDDKLSKWFPSYPNADRITLAMLANSSSGYADYVADPSFVANYLADPFRQWSPEELTAIAFRRPMVCAPATCWSYAHTNFVVLGQVLEKATGRPLDELIREGVLDPLSLQDTRSEATAVIQEPVLHAFGDERDRYEETTYWNPSWTLARGAVMTSSIGDLLKSAAAIGTGALLSPPSHAQQIAPATAKLKPWTETVFYGLGIVVLDGWLVQFPSFSGYGAGMAYLPSRRIAIALAVTLREDASVGDNRSIEIAKEITAWLVPEAPFDPHGMR
jgi:D-alanyl-D-alanine carboxypeptidase